MIINYPTYYLVTVEPVILDVDQVQDSNRNIDENIYEDIFALIDEEYVIESTK